MKKKKKLLGGIGTIVVVIIFIMICSGAFDDQASDLTDGAYGHGMCEIFVGANK